MEYVGDGHSSQICKCEDKHCNFKKWKKFQYKADRKRKFLARWAVYIRSDVLEETKFGCSTVSRKQIFRGTIFHKQKVPNSKTWRLLLK